MITHQQEKGGILCRLVLPVVMRKFGQGKVGGPIRLLVVSVESEVRFYPLIISLGLSVSTWVVCRGDILLNPQRAA